MAIRRLSFLTLLTAICALAALSAQAAGDIPPAVVAVLDYQSVVRNSAAGQKVREQIDAYRANFQQEIAEEEQRLKETEANLQRQQTILAPAAFEEKRRDFERNVIAMQRKAQDRSHQLDRSLNAAIGRIQAAIIPIVQRLTKELGFNVVVDKTQVLFARRALDITEKVLQELDRTLPHVDVPKPGE